MRIVSVILLVTASLAAGAALPAGLQALSFSDAPVAPAHVAHEDHAEHGLPTNLPDHAAHEAGANLTHVEHGVAGDDHNTTDHSAHKELGMERVRFPAGTGTTPTSGTGLVEFSSLAFESDDALANHANVTGSGTLADPYVLRGLAIRNELSLVDTDACIVVLENFITGQLALNWNGPCLHVHHNYIRDLRVNENNARVGYATGGLIEMNRIGIVGQLRHFDGEFRDNVVDGPGAADLFDTVLETTLLIAPDRLAANIDGFNQGLIHHNTFHGSVDLDFHGHHHGTGFFAPHSHYHGDSSDRMLLHRHNHTDRWTSVSFTDNLIIDPEGYGLRYEDQNHAGDDRTANSESTEQLDDPHVHHSLIVIARNTIEGGHLWVDVFNSGDELHTARNPGTVEILDNTVTLTGRYDTNRLCLLDFDDWSRDWAGIRIAQFKEADITVKGNVLAFTPRPADPVMGLLAQVRECPLLYGQPKAIGVLLEDGSSGRVDILDNTMTGFEQGVTASRLDASLEWRVDGNDFGGAQERIHTDGNGNPPAGSDP